MYVCSIELGLCWWVCMELGLCRYVFYGHSMKPGLCRSAGMVVVWSWLCACVYLWS